VEYRLAFRLMAYLFFAYSSLSIMNNYIPIFYREEGLSGTQIGILTATGPLASMMSQPLWGYLSDKYKSIKRMVLITLAGVLVMCGVFRVMDSFHGYLTMMFLLFIFLSSSTALGDSLSQKTAARYGLSFGRIRMWGSLGFASGSLAAGYILTAVGVDKIFVLMIFTALISLSLAVFLKDVPASNKLVTIFHALKMVSQPNLLFFLLCCVFIATSHRTNDQYIGIYIVELGGETSFIGWGWFIALVTEAIVFATSAFWFHKFHPLTVVIASGVIYTVRWFVLSSVTNPEWVLPLQILHGFTYSLYYMAALQYVTRIVPEQLQATGQLLLITVTFGLCGIIGSLLGGWMIEAYSLSVLYNALGFIALAGTIFLLIYQRLGVKQHSVSAEG
jgi:PPP family 3-phenylpropionic acid transporter